MKHLFIFLLFAFVFSSSINAQTDSLAAANPPDSTSISTMEKVIDWYMGNMNYWTVSLLMTVESSFIPFPSEVVVPPAAYKASQPDSGLNLFLVVLFATLGAVLGAIINYYLALFLGRPLIYRLAESRIGRLCLLSKEKVQKAEEYFRKHGKTSTFIGRLVPGIRQLISIPAGLSKMHLGSFILYTAIGAGIWNIILAILGYIAHGSRDLINAYSHELSIGLLVLAGVFVLYLVYNAVKKPK